MVGVIGLAVLLVVGGWLGARDRATRRTVLDQQIKQALDEAQDLAPGGQT